MKSSAWYGQSADLTGTIPFPQALHGLLSHRRSRAIHVLFRVVPPITPYDWNVSLRFPLRRQMHWMLTVPHLRLDRTWAVSVCWFFNGILSLTFPALMTAFTPTGAFSWYAAWNFFGMAYTYFLLPETKQLSLEELDEVFALSNRKHAAYYIRKLPYDFGYITSFGKKNKQADYGEYLYEHEKLTYEEREKRGTFAEAAAGH